MARWQSLVTVMDVEYKHAMLFGSFNFLVCSAMSHGALRNWLSCMARGSSHSHCIGEISTLAADRLSNKVGWSLESKTHYSRRKEHKWT